MALVGVAKKFGNDHVGRLLYSASSLSSPSPSPSPSPPSSLSSYYSHTHTQQHYLPLSRTSLSFTRRHTYFSSPSTSTTTTTCCQARRSSQESPLEAASKHLHQASQAAEPVVEEEEVEISWVQEKAEDLVRYTGEAIGKVPGPRVGSSSLPWLVALPLGYMSITFLIAVYKTIRKFSSPKEKRRRQVGRNAFLVRSLDEFFPSKRLEFNEKKLRELGGKCGFDTHEVLRKYIRYALNERPFNPDVVADLIHLRKVSKLDDEEVAEVLNEVSRRIVKEKGPVVMDLRGFTEKGVKRKAAVQSLFSKLLYLSELEEFCTSSSRSSVTIKELFGVTDEDANTIRIDTLSELSDVDSLEKMVTLESDDEKSEGG